MSTPSPRTPDERELERLQKKVTEGETSRDRRDALAFKLWQDGMIQKDIAARLDRADRSVGGNGVTHAMIQKVLYRMRAAQEQELLDAART